MTKRRRDLGMAAAVAQPDHVVDILGKAPGHDGEALERWSALAGHIEA